MTFVIQLTAADKINPCEKKHHYLIDDEEGFRSGGQMAEDKGQDIYCDRRITEGWYRVRSPAGNDIPTACVPEGYCNTIGTIWMDGKEF